jgi:hypothetical protein
MSIVEDLFAKKGRIDEQLKILSKRRFDLLAEKKKINLKLIEVAEKRCIEDGRIDKLKTVPTKRISEKKKQEITVSTMKILGIRNPTLVASEIQKRILKEKNPETIEES